MDKTQVKEIGTAAKAALEDLAAQFGLELEYSGGKYDEDTFTPRFVFKQSGAAEREFGRCAPAVGLEPDDYGRVVIINGASFRLTGVNLRARRFPILGTALASGKTYKLTESAVLQALGR